MSPDKDAYYPGEPIAVNVRLRNADLVDLDFELLPVDAFSFTVKSKEGAKEYKGERPDVYNRHTMAWPRCFRRVTLAPNACVDAPLLLLEWFSFPFPVGHYRVRSNVLVDYCSKQTKEVTFDFRILPDNESVHRETLAALFAKCVSEAVYNSSCIGPCETLASARSNLAVSYQAKLLTALVPTLNWTILESLQHSNTVSAAEALMTFVYQFNNCLRVKGDSYSIPTAIRSVYALRDKGDLEVVKVTEAFVMKYPCPEKPFLSPD
jgi:hypothetical protein